MKKAVQGNKVVTFVDSAILACAPNGGEVQWPGRGDYHWGEPELGYYTMTNPFTFLNIEIRISKSETNSNDREMKKKEEGVC
jgi:hypothetical protein